MKAKVLGQRAIGKHKVVAIDAGIPRHSLKSAAYLADLAKKIFPRRVVGRIRAVESLNHFVFSGE
jgi:hypothetical protein